MTDVSTSTWRRLLVDSAVERAIRLTAIVGLTAFEAIMIDARYRWARGQNSHLQATWIELVDYPSMPILTGIVGILGNNLRIWSWLFVAYCGASAYWTVSRISNDDGQMFTRLLYEDTILRLALPPAAFGIAALVAVNVRSSPTKGWKIYASLALIPLWCASLLFLRT